MTDRSVSDRKTALSTFKDPKLPFDARIERADSLTYVELLGELDLSCEERFDEIVGAVRSGRLVLDMRGLTFIDSAGLRMILRTWERSDEDGFALEIVGGSDQVLRVFQMTGLDQVLPMTDQISFNGDSPNSNGSGPSRPPNHV